MRRVASTWWGGGCLRCCEGCPEEDGPERRTSEDARSGRLQCGLRVFLRSKQNVPLAFGRGGTTLHELRLSGLDARVCSKGSKDVRCVDGPRVVVVVVVWDPHHHRPVATLQHREFRAVKGGGRGCRRGGGGRRRRGGRNGPLGRDGTARGRGKDKGGTVESGVAAIVVVQVNF